MTIEQTCTRCGEVLNASKAVWLDLNVHTGEFREEPWPESESQGGFVFGRACARRQLTEQSGVAQSVERLAVNEDVPGSSPGAGATSLPERVQLRRTKGWRMPANTVKVDRSTRWGNPWAVGKWGPLERKAIDAVGSVGLFRAMFGDREMRAAAHYPHDLSPLRGKNLACWCPLNQPCHADVLIEIANADPVSNPDTKPGGV